MSPSTLTVAILLQLTLLVAQVVLWRKSRRERRDAERKGLELVHAETMGALAAPALDDLEPTITAALAKIAAVTRAVHVSLHTGEAIGASIRPRTFVHPRPPTGADSALFSAGLPYIYSTVAEGREFRTTGYWSLPKHAAIDVQTLKSLGVRSGFVLPIYVRGAFRGAIAVGVGWLDRWREEWIEPVRQIGQAVLTALVEREEALATGTTAAQSEIVSFEAFFVTVDRDARVLFVNAHRLLPDVTVGATYPPRHVLDEDYRALLQDGVQRVINHEVPYVGLVVGIAGDRWLMVHIEPLRRPEGGAVITHHDITSRKQREASASRALDEVAHQNRVGALGELASSLAHEINQPLSAIVANGTVGAQLAAAPSPDLSQILEVFEEVVGDARRAANVISQMRTLLKRGPGPAVVADLNAVAASTVTLVESEAAQRRVRIVVDFHRSLAAVRMDSVQLQQVLLNLLTNALDAASSRTETRREVRLVTSQTPGWVEFAVEDSGPGVPAARAEKIFEPFFSTKAMGLGVGLSICRSIVSVAGGRIWMEPGALGGARMCVQLPAVAAHTGTPSEPEAYAERR